MKIIKNEEISDELRTKIIESTQSPDSSCDDLKFGILVFDADSASRESRNKVVHDIRSGIRTLKNAVENLHDGHKFDDSMADLKIQAIDRSIVQLERHLKILEEIQSIP